MAGPTIENSKFYAPYIGYEVPAHDILAPGLPLQSPFRDRYSQRTYLIMPQNAAGRRDRITLYQTSPAHMRTFVEKLPGKSEILLDEFGNPFRDVNHKAIRSTDPKILIDSSGRFLISGLQTDNSLMRTTLSSYFMRSRNVWTEMTFQVSEPEEFHYQENIVSPEELMDKLLANILYATVTEEEKMVEFRPVPLEKVEEARVYFENTKLVTTKRAEQVNETLGDYKIALLQKSERFTEMLESAFSFFNDIESSRADANPHYLPFYLQIDDIKDVVYYFETMLSENAARNIAGMHNLGLVHNFLHSGNVSIVGSIRDLDSVTGVLLGDPEVTQEDKKRDIEHFLGMDLAGSSGAAMTLQVVALGYLNYNGESNKNFILEFYKSFFKTYFQVATHTDILLYIDIIYGLYEEFNTIEGVNTINLFLKPVTKEIGWNYNYPESLQDMASIFIKDEIQQLTGSDLSTLELKEKSKDVVHLQDRMIDFIVSRVDERARNALQEKFPELRDTYGEKQATIICDMFVKREVNRLINLFEKTYTEEMYEYYSVQLQKIKPEESKKSYRGNRYLM